MAAMATPKRQEKERWIATLEQKVRVLDYLRQHKCNQIKAVQDFNTTENYRLTKQTIESWVKNEEKTRNNRNMEMKMMDKGGKGAAMKRFRSPKTCSWKG